MDVIRTLAAGAPGTRRFHEHYGDTLVCVRHRRDSAGKQFTTVELIVAEINSSERHFPVAKKPTPNCLVYLRIGHYEIELREHVKAMGGCWDREKKLWQLQLRQVTVLGLQNRIVQI